jgi:hypothetical protein
MRLGAARSRSPIAPGLVLNHPVLEKHGLRVRRGQTSITIAAPGVGKSQLWLNLAHRMKVPTIYWSADTDQADVTIRSFALELGLTTAEVEQKLLDDTWRTWMYDRFGHSGDHIDWVFDSPITGERLAERGNAFAEKHGEYPHLAILDNLSNAVQNPADEYAEIKQIQTSVQALARRWGCHVAVLAHAKGEYDAGNKPIPQSGGLQNPFKIPELGITLCRPDEESSMDLYRVKQRGGKSDPGARHPITLGIDFARATVQGFTKVGG